MTVRAPARRCRDAGSIARPAMAPAALPPATAPTPRDRSAQTVRPSGSRSPPPDGSPKCRGRRRLLRRPEAPSSGQVSRPSSRRIPRDAGPNLVDIATLMFIRAAGRNHPQPAAAQSGGERAPSFRRPLLGAIFRSDVHYGVAAADRGRRSAGGRPTRLPAASSESSIAERRRSPAAADASALERAADARR